MTTIRISLTTFTVAFLLVTVASGEPAPGPEFSVLSYLNNLFNSGEQQQPGDVPATNVVAQTEQPKVPRRRAPQQPQQQHLMDSYALSTNVNPFFGRAQPRQGGGNSGGGAGGDTCLLPQTIGTGPYRIPRWYFNAQTSRCELFYYSGCCGNANNFPTFQACQVLCEVDPCEQSRDSGTGTLQLTRFYFNTQTKICEQFTYFGSGGNRNNFQSRQECAARCPESPNPCKYGRPAQSGQSFLQCGFTSALADVCPANYYCHIGGQAITTLCCPKGSTDRCAQPRDTGNGVEQLNRWYYDPISAECRQFTYSGLQGNENNFVSQQECDQACFVNPCARGTPFRSGASIQQCSALRPNVCPNGYFCHIGADQKTTVCCQNLGPDACEQQRTIGNGAASLPRYAYSPAGRRCEPFTYSGSQGSENNFLDEETCKQRCNVYTNVCPTGEPLISEQGGFPRTCSPGTCGQPGYWCHVGSSAATTMCCPNAVNDACAVETRAVGTGLETLYRWTFDSSSRRCVPFTYQGAKGNQNNFQSRQACVAACPEYDNPCLSGKPVLAPREGGFNEPISCIPDDMSGYGCPPNAWCHVGLVSATTMCCPNAVSDACSLPLLEGEYLNSTGQNAAQRWYFDSTARTCRQFQYRGSRGNQNNFISEQTCRAKCPVFENPCSSGEPETDYRGTVKQCNAYGDTCAPDFYCHVGASVEATVCCPINGDRCTLSRLVGQGAAQLGRWAFNPTSRRCEAFNYRGAQGNANNFLTQEECEQNCPVFINPCPTAKFLFQPSRVPSNLPQQCSQSNSCPTGFWCHFGANEDTTVCCSDAGERCAQPLATGSGSENLRRFYYDPSSRQCRQFQYAGLYGNANSFVTQQQCETACPTWVNACAQGEPLLAANKPQVCTADAPCPRGYWCHVGANQATTMCCETPGGTSPCDMRQSIGMGDFSLSRWYYEPNSRSCQPFSYRGIRGNMNNFLTRSDCEATCPVWVNACSTGQPILGVNNSPEVCDPLDPTSCPPSHWCHPGGELATTSCCPGRRDPCADERNEGQGSLNLSRWYFDYLTRRCLPFTYRGILGSQNNFLSREQCESSCNVFESPCPQNVFGSAAVESLAQIRQCSPLGGSIGGSSGCPPSQWCHVGATQETTICCPSAGDACAQPRSTGSGQEALQRWYFDSASRQCRPFTYSGTRGNQNNFLSQQDCERICPVFVNPCTNGEPYSVAGRPQQCTPQFPCPSGYWCHIGAEADTTVCCRSNGDPCQQPMVQGQGTAALARFYFDPLAQDCIAFTYRGLQGSQNSFLTQDDCVLTCDPFTNPCAAGDPQQDVNGRPQQCQAFGGGQQCQPGYWCHFGADQETTVCCPATGDACDQRRNAGDGPASLNRWYYDANSRTCQQFQYRGLLGNQNNFLSQQACQEECPVYTNPCQSGAPLSNAQGKPVFCTEQNQNTCGSSGWCHIGDPRVQPTSTICCPGRNDPCAQPMNQGSGSSALPRWYYNSVTMQCVAFTYRGLFGNQNNFLSQADCAASCNILDNPCAQGSPATTPNGPQFCSQNGPSCPRGHYCHVGASRDTTLCCPIVGPDPCRQEQNSGSGQSSLPRYYYDNRNHQCLPFTYSGVRGNQNNFLSQFDCEQLCPVYDNACAVGEPLLDSQTGRPRACTFDGNQCGGGYWCHIGAGPATTMCCRSSSPNEDRCSLQMSMGFGNDTLLRWHASPASFSCRQFTYSGAKGNANNFVTEQQCLNACPMDSGPCADGPVADAQFCSPTATCAAGFYCHYGGTPQDMICCPASGDACEQGLSRGEGQASLARFYYDRSTSTCQQFAYRGRKGNQNNFMTLEQCESTCDVYPNPCAQGKPYIAGTSRVPQSCNGLSTDNDCPTGFWCHVGANQPNTVCCPGDASQACQLPVSRGVGEFSIPRWYFDRNSRTCEQFTYAGTKGNANNYVSYEACRRQCRELDNPCIGQPAITPSGAVVFCSQANRENCPVNFWCHLGATPETTLCCPGATNPCSVPLAPGTGSNDLTRWYYNAEARECRRFQYNGMRGNQNNFVTSSDCRDACPVWENPCQGNVEKDGNGQPKVCSPLTPKTCGYGYFCLVGDPGERDNSYCCEIQAFNRCDAPRADGLGQAQLSRWYFSPARKACQQFLYRGAKGNENNFMSEAECKDECIPDQNPCSPGNEPYKSAGRNVLCRPDYSLCPVGYYCHVGLDQHNTVCCPVAAAPVCEQPKVLGTGDGDLSRFYYDPETDECLTFNYTGVGGNQNNHITKQLCENECPGYRGYCPHGKPLFVTGDQLQVCGIETSCPGDAICHVSSVTSQSICCRNPSNFCPLTRDYGSCSGDEKRYGYDPATNTCVQFKYSGCGGNLNNFVSLQRCTEICCDQDF